MQRETWKSGRGGGARESIPIPQQCANHYRSAKIVRPWGRVELERAYLFHNNMQITTEVPRGCTPWTHPMNTDASGAACQSTKKCLDIEYASPRVRTHAQCRCRFLAPRSSTNTIPLQDMKYPVSSMPWSCKAKRLAHFLLQGQDRTSRVTTMLDRPCWTTRTLAGVVRPFPRCKPSYGLGRRRT
jgi:hypothetical protein